MPADPTTSAVEAAARAICRAYLVDIRPLATATEIDAQVERGWIGWKSEARAALAAGLRAMSGDMPMLGNRPTATPRRVNYEMPGDWTDIPAPMTEADMRAPIHPPEITASRDATTQGGEEEDEPATRPASEALCDPPVRTCPKCGAKAAAFICAERGCPVNGGAAHG